MPDDEIQTIIDHPAFRTLIHRRGRLSRTLAAIMAGVYFGFMMLVAFARPLLARPLGEGPLTLGLLAGLGVVLVAFALTAIYVRVANREFDPLIRQLAGDTAGKPTGDQR